MASLKLFGFKIGKDESSTVLPSFAPPVLDDGAVTLTAASHYGLSIDFDNNTKSENELITRYRELSMQPEVELAIDDIINEAVVYDNDVPEPVSLNLEYVDVSPKVKNAIEEEFKNILILLNFKSLGSDIFRRFYVDGRLNYNILLDPEAPGKGIQELRYIDPRKLTKIRELQKTKDASGAEIVTGVNEYYIYSDQIGQKVNTTASGIKISTDSIIYVTSGLMDSKRSIVLSYLHKCIKPMNQLRMIEDATIIYKISRSPERRIFYVDVGNLPKMKAEQYMKDLMTKYKNKVVYDACLDMNTLVPLLDGRTLTIRQIADEINEDKKLWVYSCDPITGKFAPGLVSWAGATKFDQKVLKITLDNGKSITCTYDHKFPVWNKGFVEAKDLIVGESMIPLYTRNSLISKESKSEYQQIFDNESKKWKFTHREVSQWKDSNNIDNEFLFNESYKNSKKGIVHHKNYNRYDNCPDNLVRINFKDHIHYHGNTAGFRIIHKEILHEISKKGSSALQHKLKNDPEFYDAFSQAQKDAWTDARRKEVSERGKLTPKEHFSAMNVLANEARWNSINNIENRKKHSDKQTIVYPKDIYSLVEYCAERNLNGTETLKYINSTLNFNEWNDLNKDKHIRNKESFTKFSNKDLKRICKYFGFAGIREFRLFYNPIKSKDSILYNNHKIVSIEYLNETIDVGTLSIDNDEKYHNYHTFALDSGIYTKNSTGSIRDDRRYLSFQEDYWMPRRDGKSTEITTLPSSGAFDDMSMVEYFERKVYQALNVPYSRHSDPDSGFDIGRSDSISRDEVKFSKFIGRLRNKFSDLFDQALKVQCIAKGVCTADEFETYKQSFLYDWKKDNNYAELKNAELINNRVTLLNQVDPYVGKYFSQSWIQHKVLNMTDDEIEEVSEQIEEEVAQGLYPDQKVPQISDQEQAIMDMDQGSGQEQGSNIPNNDQQEVQEEPKKKEPIKKSNGNPYYNV